MNLHIIVQARTNSSRLPNKVMLPVLGQPILAFNLQRLRLVERANQVIVATTESAMDDQIVSLCDALGISYYRGSECDVLARYWETTQQFASDVIVRITADCPLIDPAVVDRCIEKFLDDSYDYLSNTQVRTFPRGMDVEIFSRQVLEYTYCHAITSFDREHVTPYFRLHPGNFRIGQVTMAPDLSQYRFTLDYAEDYEQLRRLLELLWSKDPGFNLERLMATAQQQGLLIYDAYFIRTDYSPHPLSASPFKRVGLGTAQFGMFYGKFNRHGIPSLGEVTGILRRAVEAGLSVLDTARSYEQSEQVLGVAKGLSHIFRIVTKTRLFKGEHLGREEAGQLRLDLEESLRKLCLEQVYGLLVHHSEDLLKPGADVLYQALQEVKAAGLVQKIGVSLYNEQQARSLLEHYDLDLVQLPLSVLNRTLLDSGCISALHARGIEIHARSVFIQGLLLADPAQLPDFFLPLRHILQEFQQQAREAGMTPAQAALRYVLDQPEIAIALIGVDSQAQLNEIIDGFSLHRPISFPTVTIEDSRLISPVDWRD